jgi:mycothiol synthase
MAFTSRPYASLDDLRDIQAALTAAWLTPRRPLIPQTIGDVAWWLAGGGADADWPARIRIWSSGGRTVGWGWLNLPATLDWFVAPDVDAGEERALRRDMLDWATAQSTALAPTEPGAAPRPLEIWAPDGWPEADLVAGLGFTRTDEALTQLFQTLDRELPEPELPAGYAVRTVRGPEEIPARVEVHRSAFAPSKMTIEKYEILVGLPGYRYDLDAVVVAPDGSFAAFTMCWLDPVAGVGLFEPVGTHQDHRKLGLGKAVNLFGLHRLREEGAREALSVGGVPPDRAASQVRRARRADVTFGRVEAS